MSLHIKVPLTFGGVAISSGAAVGGVGVYDLRGQGLVGITGGTTSSGLLTSTVNSDPFDCLSLRTVSATAEIDVPSGTTAVGSLQLQGTDDPTAVNGWTNFGTPASISVASPGPGYASVQYDGLGYRFVRVQYTFTSGGSAATMKVHFRGKGITNG